MAWPAAVSWTSPVTRDGFIQRSRNTSRAVAVPPRLTSKGAVTVSQVAGPAWISIGCTSEASSSTQQAGSVPGQSCSGSADAGR